jgi:hypothetical protein
MQRTRWTAAGVIIPAIAVLALACDQRTPTEAEGPNARQAEASFSHEDNDNDGGLEAEPFVFVGSASQCGGVAGSRIVTAAWLGGMGLPDNGDTELNTPQSSSDRDGLLLNKNGLMADCSSSGARIRGVRGTAVDATFTLGFDYRDGGHCGAGAPRFNVTTRAPNGSETFHFVGGCGNEATPTPAPQDGVNWSRVRFTNPEGWFPPALPGSRIVSISILYDEGTDVPSSNGKSQEPSGIGLAVIDNIFINGRFIREGSGDAEP